MVEVPNRPFGALKDPSFSADMTHQKGPPATARGVSWGRCGGTDNVTNQPAHDARPSSLHRRLTVALANASDRARLAELLAGDLSALGAGRRSPLLRSEDLWLAADGVRPRARRRSATPSGPGSTPSSPARCTTATRPATSSSTSTGWVRTLREGAEWATELHEALPGPPRGCRGGPRCPRRAARRAAGGAAGSRAGPGAARRGGRRHRGGRQRAGRAGRIRHGRERAATRARGGRPGRPRRRRRPTPPRWPTSRRSRSRRRACRCVARRRQPGADRGRHARRRGPEADAIADVRDALAAIQSVMIDGEVDRTADALADGLGRPARRSRAARRPATAGPSTGRARRRPEPGSPPPPRPWPSSTPRRRPARSPPSSGRSSTPPTPPSSKPRSSTGGRSGRRRGPPSARAGAGGGAGPARPARLRRLPRRRAHRWPRPCGEPGPRRRRARALRGQGRPGGARARRRRPRPSSTTSGPSGTGCSSRSPTSSASTRAMPSSRCSARTDPSPRALQAPLAEALAAVGVRPVGMSLDDAARRSSRRTPSPRTSRRGRRRGRRRGPARSERRVELAAIEARWAAVEDELRAAEAEVDRTAEALADGASGPSAPSRASSPCGPARTPSASSASRPPSSCGPRSSRSPARCGAPRRTPAPPSTPPAQARRRGRGRLRAGRRRVIGDLARRARKLAEELPIDQRPEGDPLDSLLELAERLREHAEVLRPEIDRAEAAVAAASVQLEEALAARRLAGDGNEGPQAEDLVEGLRGRSSTSPSDVLLVLDEPFVGVDHGRAGRAPRDRPRQLGATARSCSSPRTPTCSGWAIELPLDEATAVPADALLARDAPAARHRRSGAAPASPSPPLRADVTEPVPTSPIPTPRPPEPDTRTRADRPPLGRSALSTGDPPCSARPTSEPSSPWPWPFRWPRSSRSPGSRCSTRRPRSTEAKAQAEPRGDLARARQPRGATCRTSATEPPST